MSFGFTQTWLNPGMPDSAVQPGEDIPVHRHQPAGCSGLGDDAVRLPLHAGAGEAGEVWQPPAVLHHCAARQDSQAGLRNSPVFVFSLLWSRRKIPDTPDQRCGTQEELIPSGQWDPD